MRSTTEDVRSRLISAARHEFAQVGLAGARVDRIAASAAASKERLYAYFSDKRELFIAVLEHDAAEFFEAVRLDPEDIPAFVGDLFDHNRENPEHFRMMSWARLDGLEVSLPDGPASPGAKRQAIRDGQLIGTIDASWDADALLSMLFALGLSWSQAPNEYADPDDPAVVASRRRAAIEGARRLVAPSER